MGNRYGLSIIKLRDKKGKKNMGRMVSDINTKKYEYIGITRVKRGRFWNYKGRVLNKKTGYVTKSKFNITAKNMAELKKELKRRYG